MTSKTPQERLEIREFILDANLYLIRNSLFMVSCISVLLYYQVIALFHQDKVDLVWFAMTTVVFITMLMFSYMGFKSIRTQKEYISRLDTVFEIDEEKQEYQKGDR